MKYIGGSVLKEKNKDKNKSQETLKKGKEDQSPKKPEKSNQPSPSKYSVYQILFLDKASDRYDPLALASGSFFKIAPYANQLITLNKNSESM